MTADSRTEEEITISGNPGNPVGDDGERMLGRMNESHSGVTGWALGFFSFGETDRVLDIGCGGGAALRRMSESVAKGHLVGIDHSPVSVATSEKNNAADITSGKMEIITGTVEKMPFPDDSFDKVLTVESFYFWPDPEKNLREVLRVTKRGGTFLLVADIYGRNDLSEKAKANIERFGLFNPTPEEFRTLLESAGFTGVKIHLEEKEGWICAEGHK